MPVRRRHECISCPCSWSIDAARTMQGSTTWRGCHRRRLVGLLQRELACSGSVRRVVRGELGLAAEDDQAALVEHRKARELGDRYTFRGLCLHALLHDSHHHIQHAETCQCAARQKPALPDFSQELGHRHHLRSNRCFKCFSSPSNQLGF